MNKGGARHTFTPVLLSTEVKYVGRGQGVILFAGNATR